MSDAIVGYGGSVAGQTGVKRWRLSRSVKVIDVTSMSSGGKREVKAGVEQWEGEYVVNETPTVTIGSTALGTLSTGTATGTAAVTYTGSMLINDITPETPYDDQVQWTVRFTGNLALS